MGAAIYIAITISFLGWLGIAVYGGTVDNLFYQALGFFMAFICTATCVAGVQKNTDVSG